MTEFKKIAKMKIIAAIFTLFFITTLFSPSISLGITIKEEAAIGKEFLKEAHKRYQFIDDEYILSYLNEVGKDISSHAKFGYFDFNFYMIKDKTYNAFAAPGGYVFVNSGLFAAMDNEEDLTGILAHEIAHIACRHISQKIERSSKIQIGTLVGLIAGAFLGSAGGFDTGGAVAVSSIAAGQSFALAYSREDEMQADNLALNYLKECGYTGAGLIDMLEKIRAKEWMDPETVPVYLSTHPSSKERIIYLTTMLYKKVDEKKEDKNKRDKKFYNFYMAYVRLSAIYLDLETAKKNIFSALKKDENNPAYNYGFGLILLREKNIEKAVLYFKKALEKEPFNPYILQSLGKAFFISEEYKKADDILTSSINFIPNNKEGLFYGGLTKLRLKEYENSITLFKNLIKLDPEYKEAYYYIAEAYSGIHNDSEMHYNLGIYYKKENKIETAAFHLKKALAETKDAEYKKIIEKMLNGLKL